MKILVTLKDPDTMHDAVDDAVKRLYKPDGVSADEWADIRESRAQSVKDAITETFMEYSEYLNVSFEVDDDGTVTAKVLTRAEAR